MRWQGIERVEGPQISEWRTLTLLGFGGGVALECGGSGLRVVVTVGFEVAMGAEVDSSQRSPMQEIVYVWRFAMRDPGAWMW